MPIPLPLLFENVSVSLPEGLMVYELVMGIVLSSFPELKGVRDLLASIRQYMNSSKVSVVILDNSLDEKIQSRLKMYLKESGLNGLLLSNSVRDNVYPGMYYSISKCMLFALERLRFKAFIKLDPDSLIVGYHPEKDIAAYFERNPRAGLIGSYKYSCTRDRRDFSNYIPIFKDEDRLWREFLKSLVSSDYEIGEHVQGGAMAFSYTCLKALAEASLLANERFRSSRLGDDPILSLFVRFLGMEIHGFADQGQPFAIAYQGLPMSIREIRRQNKKIVHSVKFGPADQWRRLLFSYYRNKDNHHGEGRGAV